LNLYFVDAVVAGDNSSTEEVFHHTYNFHAAHIRHCLAKFYLQKGLLFLPKIPGS